MDDRFSVKPIGLERVDAYFEAVTSRAEGMTSAEAERFFDDQWRRIDLMRAEGRQDRTADEFAATLLGLAVMRSVARAFKEIGR